MAKSTRYLKPSKIAYPEAGTGSPQSFRASWIDRFNDWVGTLPSPAWFFYMILGIGLIGIQILFLWLDGRLEDIELLPVITFNGFFAPFLLGLIYLLDKQSLVTLNAMRPVLALDEHEIERYKYKIATMPARSPLVAGLSMLAFAIVLERLWIAPASYTALGQLPIFTVVFQIIDKSSAFLFGVFIYHTVRQLRLVSFINREHVRFKLLHFRPLQAFSKLTASTSVGLLVGVYGWMIINPELLRDPFIIGFVLVITALAAAVFVLPLYSIHNRMEMEKDKMLNAVDLDFETVFTQFNRSLREKDHDAVEKLNGTIASLEIQLNRIRAIPTWPWKPETAQFVLTAIALPLVLAILQFLVEQTIRL